MMTAEEAHRLLATGSGPSPWYVSECGRAGTGGCGDFIWSRVDRYTVLHDARRRARLILNMYCYTQWVGPSRLLAWHAVDRELRFHLLDLDAADSVPIEYGLPRTGEERPIGLPAASCHAQAVLSIQQAIADGTHRLDVPAELRGVGELLFFVNAEGPVRLWSIRCADEEVRVVSQDWFNRGDYDRGDQWPTRAARDPDTGEVVAEGMRLGVFVLDASCRDVADWLIRDPFFHPDRIA